MLVPIFAPIIIPIACATFIIPAFTKPTTITVVADDDWITAVTAVPNSTPLIGVLVSLYKISSNFSPAAFFNPSPISDIPNRNNATPLSSAKIDVIPISITYVPFTVCELVVQTQLYCLYPL